MSHLQAAVEASVQDRIEEVCVYDGMCWALNFVEALIPQLKGTGISVSISGWNSTKSTGLFLHDELQGKCIRVGSNASAGCGRMYWGHSHDFEFPSREPKEQLDDDWMMDFVEGEMAQAVSQCLQFLTPKKAAGK